MESTIKERLIEFIKHLGLGQTKFEKEVGWSNGYISKIRDGIGSGQLLKLFSKYPELRQEWLINGEGPMLKTDATAPSAEEAEKKSEDKPFMVPLVSAEVTAGGLPMMDNSGEMVQYMPRINCPVPADLAMTVAGCSMEPTYPDGCHVLLRLVDPNIFIEWGHVYVLDTDNGAVLKEVHKAEDDNKVKCVSLNTDPKFAPYDVPKSAIRHWFKVVYMMSAK